MHKWCPRRSHTLVDIINTTVINVQKKKIKLERILRRRLRLNDIEREQHSTWATSGIT